MSPCTVLDKTINKSLLILRQNYICIQTEPQEFINIDAHINTSYASRCTKMVTIFTNYGKTTPVCILHMRIPMSTPFPQHPI